QERSEQLGKELITAAEDLTQKKENRALVTVNHERFQQELVKAEAERDEIVRHFNRLMNEAKAKELIEQRKQILEIADKALTDAESLASTLRSKHEGNKQLIAQHELIDTQRKALLSIDAD